MAVPYRCPKKLSEKKKLSKKCFFSFFIFDRDGGHHVLNKLFLSEKRALFLDGNRFAKKKNSILDNFFGCGKEGTA